MINQEVGMIKIKAAVNYWKTPGLQSEIDITLEESIFELSPK